MILPSATLRDVLDLHYLPQRLPQSAKDTRKKYHQTLNWWDRALERPAVVSDLCTKAIDEISEQLAARGINEISLKNFRKLTLTLWWYLADVKAVSNAPWRRPKGKPRTMPRITAIEAERIARELIASDPAFIVATSREWATRIGCSKTMVIGLPAWKLPKPERPENWSRASFRRREKKRRLITVSQAAVEKLLPADRLDDLRIAYVMRKLRRANPVTIAKLGYAVDELEFLLDRTATISDLTDENIQNVMHQVVENGRAISTANTGYRKNLVALWNFAARRGILPTFPDVDKFTEPKRKPVAWSQDELRRLWTACTEQIGEIAGIKAADWLIALHSVLWDTGERIGAMLQARWDCLDLSTDWLTIAAESRKGKAEDKSWPLHPETLALLERIRKPERDLIFPWPFDPSTLYLRYSRMLKRAGLPYDRKRKFHCLRKSAASWFKAAGGNPTELLGHSDAATTKVYLAPEIVQTQHASQMLFRPDALRVVPVRMIEGPS